MGKRSQPTKNYFKVSLDGVEVSGFIRVHGLTTGVSESKPEMEGVGPAEPGLSMGGKVKLVKKRTREQPFWNWLKAIQQGDKQKKTVTIELVYRSRPLRGWKLINAWPSNWLVSDITDNTTDIVEEIELSFEEMELI